jgi:hypothetical protein
MILCIAAAEIGENTALYFGFNWTGIPIVTKSYTKNKGV